ncbi:probable serine/threonine-protein kinase PIX13, partial [Salvia splendens]|uniref:probable serine/threonine-protein kinase PIX13 n=1 Tax=Salvia splendens TaxID=180675 RepID=UPI001C26A0DC
CVNTEQSNRIVRSKLRGISSDDACVGSGDTLPTPTLKVYSFGDLKCATRDFRSDMVLGIGDFGTVYKGWVDEKSLQPSKLGTGMMVAIKKLNPQSMQDFDEWQSEVDLFGKLTHPNMVKLLGYCWEDREMLLVYEFMQKGSLENHLFRRSAYTKSLPWDIRLKIAIGAAKGLAFLHASDSNYRDFKASNILLDGNFNAKISDLWLVKLEPSRGNATLQMAIGAANEMAFLNASYSIYRRAGDHPYIHSYILSFCIFS